MRPLLFALFACLQFQGFGQLHMGPGQPYANIQAAAGAALPGDTIYVHGGTYAAYQYVNAFQGAADALDNHYAFRG